MIEYDDSNRTNILYSLIQSYIKNGMKFLDIGCGYAHFSDYQGTCLLKRIEKEFSEIEYVGIDRREEVIKLCKAEHPNHTWIDTDIMEYKPEKRFDLVIHVGIDRPRYSDAWMFHEKRLLSEKALNPFFVLLESGCPRGQSYSEHMAAWMLVCSLYRDNGYAFLNEGSYLWSAKVTQPQRYFKVFQR